LKGSPNTYQARPGVDAGWRVLFGVAVGLHPVRSSVRDISP
jgi:hypothetical protein